MTLGVGSQCTGCPSGCSQRSTVSAENKEVAAVAAVIGTDPGCPARRGNSQKSVQCGVFTPRSIARRTGGVVHTVKGEVMPHSAFRTPAKRQTTAVTALPTGCFLCLTETCHQRPAEKLDLVRNQSPYHVPLTNSRSVAPATQ